MRISFTTGAANTVTCPFHFLELELELRHQEKSNLERTKRTKEFTDEQLQAPLGVWEVCLGLMQRDKCSYVFV